MGDLAASLDAVRVAALRQMGQASRRGWQPTSILSGQQDSFDQEEPSIRDSTSLASLGSLASTVAMEVERRASTDTFTVNLLPASNPHFSLPPIDSDLAASSTSTVQRMRKISKVMVVFGTETSAVDIGRL